MNFKVITLFPDDLKSCLSFGVVGRAIESSKLTVETINPRQFTSDVHHTVDDRPFGGGDGMVMKYEPLRDALQSIPLTHQSQIRIHMSPRGMTLTDHLVRTLVSHYEQVIIVSSRYAGIDQRLINDHIDLEISVGDFVVSGGELPAALLIDACARMIPGVLGHSDSAQEESFAFGKGLEAPQFTRPEHGEFGEVPKILLSGHHAHIQEWRECASFWVTFQKRRDLLKIANSTSVELPQWCPSEKKLKKFLDHLTRAEFEACGLMGTAEELWAQYLKWRGK